jgi:hypothetical protein
MLRSRPFLGKSRSDHFIPHLEFDRADNSHHLGRPEISKVVRLQHRLLVSRHIFGVVRLGRRHTERRSRRAIFHVGRHERDRSVDHSLDAITRLQDGRCSLIFERLPLHGSHVCVSHPYDAGSEIFTRSPKVSIPISLYYITIPTDGNRAQEQGAEKADLTVSGA